MNRLIRIIEDYFYCLIPIYHLYDIKNKKFL